LLEAGAVNFPVPVGQSKVNVMSSCCGGGIERMMLFTHVKDSLACSIVKQAKHEGSRGFVSQMFKGVVSGVATGAVGVGVGSGVGVGDVTGGISFIGSLAVGVVGSVFGCMVTGVVSTIGV
jgi:hypothetical protein